LSQITPKTRDIFLKAINLTRTAIPGIDLAFSDSPPRYDSERDVIVFVGEALGHTVRCAISREALDDNFGATSGSTKEERLGKFRRNRQIIERMAREKYLNFPVDEAETVLIRTIDVPKLMSEIEHANKPN
jgi:hypothetical protein